MSLVPGIHNLRSEKNLSLGFPIRFDRNRSVRAIKGSWRLEIVAARCREYVAKTKALLSRAITALLICAFVFACSHNAGF